MNASFLAYVDESGDEGFAFNEAGSGSSRWFILSAVVIRQTNDLHMVSCLKQVREVLRDGFCEVIFSNRSNMSYEEIRDYLRLLLNQAKDDPQKVQKDFEIVKSKSPEALNLEDL